jgi:hypothetical protein
MQPHYLLSNPMADKPAEKFSQWWPFGLILFIAGTVAGARLFVWVYHQTGAGLSQEESRIVAIAMQTAAERQNGNHPLDWDPPIKHPNGSWTVTVWWDRRVQGGSCDVEIDSKGPVTRFRRGL